MIHRLLIGAALIAISSGAAAGPAEVGYPKDSLGYAALMKSDTVTAERQIRENREVAANDPARLVQLGALLVRTGRQAEGAALLEKALAAEDIELVLGDGRTMWSHDLARRSLDRVRTSYAGR